MSPNDYNQRFYYLVRSESFYAKRLSAMNEEICEAFLNISRFLIDEGYVSNAREVDNIVEALPEQALANMFDDDTFATKFKIALKAVNPRLSENSLSGEKRQAAAIALKLLEYSKNNATYLKPGSKAPEKDAEGAAGEYNPRGSEKKAKGGSGAVNATLKGKVSQTEEVEQVDEIAPAVAMVGKAALKTGAKALAANAMKKKEETNEETEVEEGYKAIDKKKETAMYRRAGNLARTSLASKGKKKEEAQTKSAKIVSAISSQKERERFAKMGDEKARDNYKEEAEDIQERGDFWHPDPDKDRKLGGPGANQRAREDRAAASQPKKDYSKSLKPGESYYDFAKRKRTQKEEVEIHEEEGKKDACYHKVKSRYSVWPSAYASGALVKCRKKGAANWGNSKKEAFDIDALLNDPIFDQITEEELLHFAFDIFEEMEQEGILTEAAEYFDDVLLEDRYASAVAQSKANAATPAARAGRRNLRKQKVMGALKTAAGAVKKAGSAAAGRAAEMAKRSGDAAKKAAGTATKAVGAAARGGASLAKKAAVKGAAAAGEVAGAAKGGFEAGRIKAKREAMAKTKPQSKPASSSSSSDDGTKGKLDSLLKDVRGGDKKPSSSGGSSGGGSSSSGGGSSDSGTQTRKRGLLRRVGSAIKSGLKKAVGKTARGISNVSGAAASSLGEDAQMEIILDYLLEYDVCTLDDAEEVMMELTDEEITNILAESGEYDPMEDDDFDHDEAERTRGQSGKNKSITVKVKKKKMKKEETELDENRAAARAAGGYKDDSKKQTDPSKEGFTGISNSIKDIMRQNREIEARNKKK